MILVVGGAYQGKQKFVQNKFSIKEEDCISGKEVSLEGQISQKVVTQLHFLVKRLLENNKDIEELLERLDNHIIICDEIGGGIVPIVAQEEEWREATGRLCCQLAQRAQKVYWVHAGIAQCIKGGEPWILSL